MPIYPFRRAFKRGFLENKFRILFLSPQIHNNTFPGRINITLSIYYINNIPLNRQAIFKDLRIWFDAKLSFSLQVNRSAHKFCHSFTNICALSLSLSSALFSLVRPILEYASCVWSAYANKSM